VRFFLAAACLLAAGVARADESAFYAAAALERDGRPAEAVEALLALVERDPGDLFADDALLESARILEERLADPVRAAALYERLARDYPASRLATRAGCPGYGTTDDQTYETEEDCQRDFEDRAADLWPASECGSGQINDSRYEV